MQGNYIETHSFSASLHLPCWNIESKYSHLKYGNESSYWNMELLSEPHYVYSTYLILSIARWTYILLFSTTILKSDVFCNIYISMYEQSLQEMLRKAKQHNRKAKQHNITRLKQSFFKEKLAASGGTRTHNHQLSRRRTYHVHACVYRNEYTHWIIKPPCYAFHQSRWIISIWTEKCENTIYRKEQTKKCTFPNTGQLWESDISSAAIPSLNPYQA